MMDRNRPADLVFRVILPPTWNERLDLECPGLVECPLCLSAVVFRSYLGGEYVMHVASQVIHQHLENDDPPCPSHPRVAALLEENNLLRLPFRVCMQPIALGVDEHRVKPLPGPVVLP